MMAAVFLDRCQDVLPEQSEVKNFQEYLMDEGYSNSHVNNTMNAVEYYYSFHNQEFDFKRLNRPKQLPEILSASQVRRIIYACDTYRDYAIIKTLASSGVRASELCNLDVTDVDFEKRKLRIRDGKFSKDGIARISESCADAIEEYLQRRDAEHESLFLSRTENRLTRSGLLQRTYIEMPSTVLLLAATRPVT